MTPRLTHLLLALNLTLALVAAVMFVRFDSARDHAQQDVVDAAVVLDDLRQIDLMHRSTRDGEPSEQLSAGLQAAATRAGIGPQLQSVEAAAGRGGEEAPTLSVRLGAVTLEQLRQFLIDLQRASPPLVSSRLHLTAPQGPDAVVAAGGETWTVEAALQPRLGRNTR